MTWRRITPPARLNHVADPDSPGRILFKQRRAGRIGRLLRRASFDRQYIDHLSLSQDLRLLAMTIAPVANGRGAY
jgi:lipopolysaccharide/colanic/teichoic acid biosynthesis glycosyltransferase